MEPLDTTIEKAGAVAYVMYASSADANMHYLTRFEVGDPVVYLKRRGARGTLIVPEMEFDRAVRESECEVMTRGDAGFFEIFKEEKDRWKINARMIAHLAGGDVIVPAKFPFALARELGEFCTVHMDKETVESMRAVKTEHELECIKATQRATERTMDLAISLIKKAEVREEELYLDGEPLTSDLVRRRMHWYLLEQGYRATNTIVSCGPETAVPHIKGDGTLMANMPIVIDVFPCDERNGYYADMSRTVVKGEPTPEIVDMYRAVQEAQALGKSLIKPGIPGADIHQAIVDFFGERGYSTNSEGFIHSLGHGVGLEVHERPYLGPSGTELAPGNVVTVEPGLYYGEIGGVRLEDMGSVTKEGFDCFTNYPEELIV